MGAKVSCNSGCNYIREDGIIQQVSIAPYKMEYSSSMPYDSSHIKVHRNSISDSPSSTISTITRKPINIVCNSVGWCLSLHRLIDALKFWNTSWNDNKSIYKYCNGKNCKFILNDYHHILSHHLSNKSTFHLNYEFELIYIEISKYIKVCDIQNCEIFKRYRRTTRETEIQFDTELGFYADTMDTIHCYFMHSYDTGIRRKCSHIFIQQEQAISINTERLTASPPKSQSANIDFKDSDVELKESDNNTTFVRKRGAQNINNDDDEEEEEEKHTATMRQETDMSYDLNIMQIKNNIRHNQSVERLNVYKRKYSKYFTDFEGAKSAAFGYRYYYWNEYRECDLDDNGPNIGYKKKDWYIYRKYKNLKDEILNNQIMRLGINKYEDALFKTKQLMETDYINGLTSDINVFNEYFEIKPKSMITMQHILSIIFYCDYTDLSYNLSKTFKRITFNEKNEEMKLRNREYRNWSKLLIETVELYGINISETETEIFYHGISYTHTFNNFQCYFCGPTSTSPYIETIEQFINNDGGIILELEKQNDFNTLKVFNCSMISFYSNEDERLFIFGTKPIRFHNLTIININNNNNTNNNYRWFIKAINIFNSCICGKTLSDSEKINLQNADYEIISNLMEHYNAESRYQNKFPYLINHLFASFVENKKKIIIDLNIMNTDYSGFCKYLLSASCTNLLRIDYLSLIFPNCENIIIYNTKNINFIYSKSMISMLQKLNMNNIKSIKQIKICNVTFNDQILNEFIINKQLQLKNIFKINAYCDIKIDTKYRMQYDIIKHIWLKIPEYSHLIIIRNLESCDQQYIQPTPMDRINSETIVHSVKL